MNLIESFRSDFRAPHITKTTLLNIMKDLLLTAYAECACILVAQPCMVKLLHLSLII